MKKIILCCLVIFLLSCNKKIEEKKIMLQEDYKSELVIMLIDDFLGQKAYIEDIKKDFQKENDCEVKIISFENENNLFAALKEDRCDLVLNLDYLAIDKVLADSSYIEYESSEFQKNLPIKDILIPYSYNFMSFAYNSDILKDPPNSFGTIQNGLLRDSFSFPHPLNSDFGKRTIVWTINDFRLGFIHVWRSLKRNLLNFSEDLEESVYALVTGEASIAPAPLTLPDYLFKKKKIKFIKNFIPAEGTYQYYQCGFIPQKTKDSMHAKLFLNYLLSKDIQSELYEKSFNLPISIDREQLKISKEINLPEIDFKNRIDYLNFNKNYKKYWEPLWKRKMKEFL